METRKCLFCGEEYQELDPSGPENVDNPVCIPNCDCADKYEEEAEEEDR